MPQILSSLGEPGLDGLLRRAQFMVTLTRTELASVLESLFGGRQIDPKSFDMVKAVLGKLRTEDPRSKQILSGFMALNYDQFLRRRMAAKVRMRPAVPYSANHIPAATPNNRRPGRALSPKFLTIHSTGNASSTAKNERNWLTNTTNDRTASFHIVVDQIEAIECIPVNEVAWHAGDGSGSGSGNRESISLEICESGDRTTTLQNAIAVAARILKQQKLGESALRQHRDWSTKVCPRILIDAQFRKDPRQTWDWFKSEVGKLVLV